MSTSVQNTLPVANKSATTRLVATSAAVTMVTHFIAMDVNVKVDLRESPYLLCNAFY